jgi:DNA-binding transcriptional LysR family regulator
MDIASPFAGNLRLQHLFLCQALLQGGTVREAARLLHRSQPAVTKMLQELESSVGVRLFERGRLGATPTPSGRAFIDRALVILNEWAIVPDELRAIGKGETGILRVGATPLTALALIPQALARFREERPGVLVRFREASIHDLLLDLNGGELDCVVGRFSGELLGSAAAGRRVQERLYDELLCVVAGVDHPLRKRRRVSWADLAAASWVLPPAELATRQSLDTAFIRAGLRPPRPAYESSSFATSISFAHQLGVLAMVPVEAARIAEAHGLVCVLRSGLAAFSAPISILRRPDAPHGASLNLFLRAVRAAAKSRPAK